MDHEDKNDNLSHQSILREKAVYESIMKMMPFGILLIGEHKDVEYHNDKFSEIFAGHPLKFSNLSDWLNMAFPDNDYKKHVQGILLFEIPFTETNGKRHYTATISTDPNEEKLIWFASVLLENGKFLIICEDITEERKLETQQQQAQTMEAIGSMAGGVAHEFNNILMGIQGYVSLMMLDTPPTHRNHEKLKAIEAQVTSGSKLTEQLLESARGGRFELKTLEPNAFIAEVASTVGRHRKEIHISEKYSTYLWAVEADTASLEQAFQIILTNAAKLLPGSGTFLLKTDNVMLDTSQVAAHGVKSGPYVRVSLTVPEAKIDGATRQKLFSPMSLLQEGGLQSGLGLASAYGIIKGHEGILETISEPGAGVTFNVYLPASSKTPHKMKQEAFAAKSRSGNETILLVDDEKVITDVTGAMLTALGYEVIIAFDGEEAVSIYQEKGDQIDLVIMDVVMPVMGGGEAIDLIRAINPSVKVILCSGYSMSGAVKAIMDKGVRTFLKKPFKLADFSQKIRDVLEG